MELASTPSDRYLEYIFSHYPDIDANILSSIEAIFESTHWDNPETSLDWNNLAVIDLIEAEQSEDLEAKTKLIHLAMQKLERGYSLDQSPHCAAHYVIVKSLLGESGKAIQLAFNTVLTASQSVYTSAKSISGGLVYLPLSARNSLEFESILNAKNGCTQSFMLLAEALWRSQFVFYNSQGIRFLRLANQLFSDSPTVHLMLGVAELMSSQSEGLVHLHHARKLAPDYAPILQALYLGYRGIGDLSTARYWLEAANDICQNSDSVEWQWTKLAVDSAIAYVAFDHLVLAVEPNFKSIVTGVLVAQGDWFEREIEFWRNGIQAGMTVIDVGANAGVYTFSAAQRVGSTGLVLAIEPFSECVAYLNETCRVNQLDWVKVCAGAASDRNGSAKLSLSSASELNELISEEEGQTRDASSFEEVECFTLDSLIEKYGVSQVDFLKIDAEGHELQVLQGCDRLLTEFAPIILYENIAGHQGSNLPVADYLRSIGYNLFRYQPYLQKLVSVDVDADIQGSLNIIALPQKSLIQ